jgi:glycosyltransferase involved in cell wall biosynthesis
VKILLCHNAYRSPGGEDQSFATERQLLERHGHQVLLYTRHNDETGAMGRVDLAWRTIWNPRTYREVAALVRRERPDVLHCTNTFPLISTAVYAAGRRYGAAVVQGLHNYRLACVQGGFLRGQTVCERCTSALVPWPAVAHACYRGSRRASAVVAAMLVANRAVGTWTRMVDAFVAPSETVRRKLVAVGLPGPRIRIVPNFLVEDPGAGTGGGGYAMFAGRLAADKGIETLLRAWSELSPPVRLKIAGDGPLAETVRRAAAADPRIEWLGWRPPPEVLQLVGGAECLILPSTFHEAFGRVIIEAYAKGTPVIGSHRGAIAELVEEGVTGHLFAPGDSRELMAKLRLLLDDAPRHAAMRRRCRLRFLERYLGDRCYRPLIEVYRAALRHRSGTGAGSSSEAPPLP